MYNTADGEYLYLYFWNGRRTKTSDSGELTHQIYFDAILQNQTALKVGN